MPRTPAARSPMAPGRALLAATAALLVASCGGGEGGGGGVTPPPPPPPPPPVTGNVTISGQVTFERPSYTANNTLDFANLQRRPVRGATVEILRDSDGTVLATTTTSETDGRYSATIPANTFRVRVKAQLQRAGAGGYDFEVRNNTAANALYTLDSSTVSPTANSVSVNLNAPTGFSTGSGRYTGTRAAAPFAILAMFWEAKLLLQGTEPGLTLPSIEIYWSTQNRAGDCNGQPNPTTGEIGTTFFLPSTIPATAGCPATQPGIYVLGDASGNSDDDTDEFDSSVIAHEFGHYYEDAFSRADSMGGPHQLDLRHDLRLAMSEGWGNAFQGFVLQSRLYRDSFGAAGGASFAFDMENNSSPFTVENGFFSEASVQEFLWDVYDGVGDETIDLGFGAIHAVMREEMRTTEAMTSVYVMADGLAARSPSQATAIRQRLQAEGILGTGEFGLNEQAVGASATTGAPADPNAVPIYVVPAFGAPVNVVSTNLYGSDSFFASYNLLGGRRYLRFELPAGGSVRITAQGPVGSDPDFILHRRGLDQCPNGGACWGLDDSVGDGREEATYSSLAPGTYVLEVVECSNLGEPCRPGPARGTTNIAVTVSLL